VDQIDWWPWIKRGSYVLVAALVLAKLEYPPYLRIFVKNCQRTQRVGRIRKDMASREGIQLVNIAASMV
jgi:hypothetical protein